MKTARFAPGAGVEKGPAANTPILNILINRKAQCAGHCSADDGNGKLSTVPNKFEIPTDPAGALYHAVTSGHIDRVKNSIADTPELIKGKPVVDGAWSHGGRRCGAQDDVIECLWLIIEHGARFEDVHVQTIDSAFKTFPRAAGLLFDHGASANAAESDGTSALHLMAEIGHRSAAQVLLEHGARTDARNASGATPIDVAMTHGNFRTAAFMKEPSMATLPTRGVRWYRADRGYGYLRDSSGYGDLFFDKESIARMPETSLEAGVEVTFQVIRDEFGLRANRVAFGVS